MPNKNTHINILLPLKKIVAKLSVRIRGTPLRFFGDHFASFDPFVKFLDVLESREQAATFAFGFMEK